MTDAVARGLALVAEFRNRFRREPIGVWAAPGRVNLIGEHTDYNDGYVLPVAIDREALVAVADRDDDVVRIWSMQLDRCGEASLTDLALPAVSGWVAYAAGVLWALRQQGIDAPGVDVVVDSDVPIGAGLSSSAALECSLALALSELAGVDVERIALAVMAQQAEQQIVGAPVGIMDQAISLLGRRDTVLLLDCQILRWEHVQLPMQANDLALVVIDTQVPHAHATGGYAARRTECVQAAEMLGLPSLRSASLDDVERLDGVLRRRARHVVTENLRVLETAELLRNGEVRGIGRLLDASHVSLRDDFEVSIAQLDLAVAAASDGGALGARMTGGGFGGSALALVPRDAVPAVASRVNSAFSRAGFGMPSVRRVTSADGARRLEMG
jgi:galactokinase